MSKADEASPVEGDVIRAALELYKPPFRFDSGYILDADGRVAYDNEGMDTMGRVRGWGRIQYLPNPEALQDKVGEMIAEAMTDFWKKHSRDKKPRYDDVYHAGVKWLNSL